MLCVKLKCCLESNQFVVIVTPLDCEDFFRIYAASYGIRQTADDGRNVVNGTGKTV